MPTPIHVFFQPLANLRMLADLGVTHFWGPEVPNGRGMAPDALAFAQQAWIDGVAAVGGKCVLKNPPPVLPAHCVGVITTVDEPNGKGVLPGTVKFDADALRAKYPGTPVYLSLAGDKITSANLRRPAEMQLLTDYLACADVVTVDCYAMNRNASRYKTTWTTDAVRTVKAVRPDVKVVAWVEVNDQRLSPPTLPDVNRAPTPQEIDDTVTAAVTLADGIGWFATCDSGKYGWPGSYWPLVDRVGVSMALQYAKLGELARRFNGTTTPPPAPAPAPAPLPEPPPVTPPPPPAPVYVTRETVDDMITEALHNFMLRLSDTTIGPMLDNAAVERKAREGILAKLQAAGMALGSPVATPG